MVKINIKGVITTNDNAWIYKLFGMDCCYPASVAAGLEEAAGEDVCVEINSCGGSCAAAFEIYTALKQYQGKVTANVIVACSAATVIACGAEETYASRASVYMIHNSQSGASGDYRDLQMEADALREINESIINVYEDKTKLSRDEIQELMDNDTYMSPAKAISKGFVDGMMPGMEADAGTDDDAVASAVANAVACAPGIFNGFADAIPADKAVLLKKILMDGMGQQDAGDSSNQTTANKENKEGENRMTLQEALESHPEMKGELDAMLKEAEGRGVTGERNRLKELDAISANVAGDALNDAKYGEKPLDAKEFAYQAMLNDKVKMSAYMADATKDAEEAGVNNVGVAPDGVDASAEEDELAGYANRRKGGKTGNEAKQ
ncbi:MAG: Clp protease ClpP [Lachnospiraceae bacterium]